MILYLLQVFLFCVKKKMNIIIEINLYLWKFYEDLNLLKFFFFFLEKNQLYFITF